MFSEYFISYWHCLHMACVTLSFLHNLKCVPERGVKTLIAFLLAGCHYLRATNTVGMFRKEVCLDGNTDVP